MSGDWRNERAILRDLAIAQGTVPVECVETVSCDEKPPSVHIQEETEEQFISQYATDGTTTLTPDFGLIQDMLDMVRDVRVNDIENTEDSEVGAAENNSPQKPAKVEKRNKNAAMESILNLQETEEEKKKPILVLNPESMFRAKSKKSVASVSKESVDVSSKSRSNMSKPSAFVSGEAQEYYNQLMEKQRQRELREETIWTRAERQMREIEEKRRNKVAN